MWIFLYEGQYLMQELQCLKSALLGMGRVNPRPEQYQKTRKSSLLLLHTM